MQCSYSRVEPGVKQCDEHFAEIINRMAGSPQVLRERPKIFRFHHPFVPYPTFCSCDRDPYQKPTAMASTITTIAEKQNLLLKFCFQWSNDRLIKPVNDAFRIGRVQAENEMRHASLNIVVYPATSFSQIFRNDPDLR
jgi:hypothetical protein